MNGEHRQQTIADPRPAYDPPRAMRLSSVESGAGACEPAGSGDVDGCSVGSFASGYGCSGNGNGASVGCYGEGSGFVT